MITGNEPAFATPAVHIPAPLVVGNETIPAQEGMTIFQELSKTYIGVYVQQGLVPDLAVKRGIELAHKTIAAWNTATEKTPS